MLWVRHQWQVVLRTPHPPTTGSVPCSRPAAVAGQAAQLVPSIRQRGLHAVLPARGLASARLIPGTKGGLCLPGWHPYQYPREVPPGTASLVQFGLSPPGFPLCLIPFLSVPATASLEQAAFHVVPLWPWPRLLFASMINMECIVIVLCKCLRKCFDPRQGICRGLMTGEIPLRIIQPMIIIHRSSIAVDQRTAGEKK